LDSSKFSKDGFCTGTGNSDQFFHNHTKKLLTFWKKNPRSISLFTFTYYSFQTKFPVTGKITSLNSIGRKSEEVGTKTEKRKLERKIENRLAKKESKSTYTQTTKMQLNCIQ